MPTRVVYRSLLLRGLSPSEAANVAAFLVGLRSAGVRWSLPQVEALVALRARWAGSDDRGASADRAAQTIIWSRS